MHAVRLHAFGPADNLRYEALPDPAPAEGQVRIAVAAAGVHVLDTTIRSGANGGPFPLPELPFVSGREVAGVVDAVGSVDDARWLGRPVVAHLGMASGGYAELALAAVGSLHELPDTLEAGAAVAMIGTGRTAMAIAEVAALTGDDVVLVTGAAGGLGTLLVQEATHVGATVVGLAGGPDKVRLVQELGADLAVDYRDPDWPKVVWEWLDGRDATALLDGVGGPAAREALELLGTGGRLVVFGWSAGEPVELHATDLVAKGLTATAAIGPKLLSRPGGLREFETKALDAAATGRWAPVVQRFPLAEAATAHRALETRQTVGKVVLVP